MIPKYLKFKVCRFKITNWLGGNVSYGVIESSSQIHSLYLRVEPKTDNFTRLIKIYDGKLLTGSYYKTSNKIDNHIMTSQLDGVKSSETQLQLRFDLYAESYQWGSNISYLILVVAESDYEELKNNTDLEEIDAIPGYDYDDAYPIPQQ